MMAGKPVLLQRMKPKKGPKGRLRKRDQLPLPFIPQGELGALDAFPQREAAHIFKLRVISEDFAETVKRYPRREVMNVVDANISCDPHERFGKIIIGASKEG